LTRTSGCGSHGAPERIAPSSRLLLAAPDTELYLSAASAWEIAIKCAAGRLALPAPPDQFIPSRMTANGVLPLPIEQGHALRSAALPLHHRDPFDRMLVAQAPMEGCKLMTADPLLLRYEVEILPVRAPGD
jgi:PIN domain nuclease of toxin-antitoxin system